MSFQFVSLDLGVFNSVNETEQPKLNRNKESGDLTTPNKLYVFYIETVVYKYVKLLTD